MKKDCIDCKYYDGECCMYKCAIRSILFTDETAQNCDNYKLGKYDALELDKNNYI